MDSRSRFAGIQLDWFNITYRSVGLTICVVLAAAAIGYYAWGYFDQGPKEQAAEAIARATSMLAQVKGLEADERIDEIRENAAVALGEATRLFGNGDYDGARIAAIRSENLSSRALHLASGDEDQVMAVRFHRIEGDVRIKRSGEFAWEKANNRMTLAAGDQVKTSASGSTQLIYFDGTVTTIQPGSLLEIRDLFEDPVTKVRRVSERLNFGQVEASTRETNVRGSYHEVSTRSASARAEEASELRVTYDKDAGSATFDSFSGRVSVISPDRRESLEAGERVRSTRDGTLTAKEIIPGVPRLIAPSDQKVFVHDESASATVRLAWEPVAGCRRYRLLIASQMLFADPLYEGVRADTSVPLEDLAPGEYYWKVASISPGGVESAFSPVRKFRVSAQRIRDRVDRIPPALNIAEFMPIGSMVVVRGTTEPGATLWINNEKVEVAPDGSFYSVVRLKKEGANKVRFVAQDAAGNETTAERSTIVETY